MLSVITSLEPPIFSPIGDFLADPIADSGELRLLKRGEVLCLAGEAKSALWRVESGIISVTAHRGEGPPEIVELACPGALLGLGFLAHHIHNMTAVVDCEVRCFPRTHLADLASLAPDAMERQATATEREFALRRRELVAQNAASPLCRVASFLAAVSSLNRAEGRDPYRVSELLRAGDVADFIGLSVEELAGTLAELERSSLVHRDEQGGLLLANPGALDRLASAAN